MIVTITTYTIPTRTQPFQINTLHSVTLNKSTAPMGIIRSPHIDKKSWEHFKFFIQKRTVSLQQPGVKNLQSAQRFARKIKTFFATVRLTIAISYFYTFKTTF